MSFLNVLWPFKNAIKVKMGNGMYSDRKIPYFVKCVNIHPKSLGFHNETHIFVNALIDNIITQILLFRHSFHEMLLIYKNSLPLTIFLIFMYFFTILPLQVHKTGMLL